MTQPTTPPPATAIPTWLAIAGLTLATAAAPIGITLAAPLDHAIAQHQQDAEIQHRLDHLPEVQAHEVREAAARGAIVCHDDTGDSGTGPDIRYAVAERVRGTDALYKITLHLREPVGHLPEHRVEFDRETSPVPHDRAAGTVFHTDAIDPFLDASRTIYRFGISAYPVPDADGNLPTAQPVSFTLGDDTCSLLDTGK